MTPNLKLPSQVDLLNYEIRSSWWAGWLSWNCLQDLAATYYAAKVRRKHKRALRHMTIPAK